MGSRCNADWPHVAFSLFSNFAITRKNGDSNNTKIRYEVNVIHQIQDTYNIMRTEKDIEGSRDVRLFWQWVAVSDASTSLVSVSRPAAELSSDQVLLPAGTECFRQGWEGDEFISRIVFYLLAPAANPLLLTVSGLLTDLVLQAVSDQFVLLGIETEEKPERPSVIVRLGQSGERLLSVHHITIHWT